MSGGAATLGGMGSHPEARGERVARALVDALRRRVAPLARWLRPLRRIPVEVRVGLIVLAIFVGSFFAAVAPLLTTGGHDPRAEISGRYPSTLRLGQDYVLPLALDNTSGAVIHPVCVIARTAPNGAVTATTAEFQGLETVAFTGGRACAGSLSGQEVINVRVTLRPLLRGEVRVSLLAGQGAQEIGPAFTGNLEVVAG